MKRRAKERRRFPRYELVCPVTLYGPDEGIPVTTDKGNLSDGGVYVSVPAEAAPAVGTRVDLTFCVPRAAEGPAVFATPARVVRRDAAADDETSGVAMRFKRPMDLELG